MRELVSVIVPTYNRAYCLPHCLDSAFSQTHSDIEVLVVDDGSTDDTRTLVHTCYASEQRLRYFYQPNQGVSAARNHGLRMAQGNFIAFLDSDDAWRPWKIELQLACLRTEPQAGMIWSDMEAVDPEGCVVCPQYLRVMYHNYSRFRTEDLFARSRPLRDAVGPELTAIVGPARLYTGEIYSAMLLGNLVHTSTVLLRRERAERVGDFNETLRPSGEDFDFHLRTCREGIVAYADVPTIQYQTGLSDQLTRPSYQIHITENFVRTIEPRLEQDRDRIRLSHHLVNSVLARAYAELGELAWTSGQTERARRSLRRSLRHRFWRPRTLLWLLLASAPQTLGALLLRIYHACRAVRNPGRRVRSPGLADEHDGASIRRPFQSPEELHK